MTEQPPSAVQQLLHISFNQDNSHFAIGTKNGYKIFDCDSCNCCYERSDGAISIIEMLYSTSLVVLVGAGEQPALSPRRLFIFNITTGSIVAELDFISSIVAVRLNHKRLVVVLESKAFIYDLPRLSVLSIVETASNAKGICAFSPNHENSHLALPASVASGAVLVYSAKDIQVLCQIEAHKSPLATMTFSADGTFLATASEQGTVIRVHTIPQASKVFTFRRGSYPASIYSLSFGPTSQNPLLLAATSSSGTVHVFMLAPRIKNSVKRIPGLIAAVIPESMSDVVESEHHFITIHDGFIPGTHSICAIAKCVDATGGTSSSVSRLDRPRIFVVTTSGYYNQYSLTIGLGRQGSFTLERECTLLTSASDQIIARFVE